MNSSRTDLEALFGRTVLPLARRWRAAADRTLADIGLSHASGWILIHVGRMGDAVAQSDLAVEADLQGPSLVRLIDRLEADGLVVRQTDESDRRIKRICLTEPGRALVAEIEAALRRLRHERLAFIDDADLRIAVRVLQQVDRSMLDGGTGGREA